jgi:hypothetical protein
MQPDILLACDEAKNNPPDRSLPILVSGTIWSVDENKNFLEEARELEIFQAGKGGLLQQVGKRARGNSAKGRIAVPVVWAAAPPLYGAGAVWFFGVSCFIDRDKDGTLKNGPGSVAASIADIKVNYTLTTTEVAPENITNLESVFSALAGLSKGGVKGVKPSQCAATLVATGKLGGTPPFDINIVMSVKPSGPKTAEDTPLKSVFAPAYDRQMLSGIHHGAFHSVPMRRVAFDRSTPEITDPDGSPQGPQAAPPAGQKKQSSTNGKTSTDEGKDCSGALPSTGCSSTNTVSSYDKEFWDLSMGISIPGVLEPKYSASNPAAPPSAKRNTDFYGFLDLYPFAPVASKASYAPHLSVGIPITGQPLYRPFFGLSENVTGWQWLQNRKFPFQMSFVAGVVYLNQEIVIANPIGPGSLIRHSRVVKPMFGVEIPISNLVSKIKAIGSGSSGSKATTGNSKAGNGGNSNSN